MREKKIRVLMLLISVHKLNTTEIKHLQPSADAHIGNYIFTTEIHGLPEWKADKTEHVGFKPSIKYRVRQKKCTHTLTKENQGLALVL